MTVRPLPRTDGWVTSANATCLAIAFALATPLGVPVIVMLQAWRVDN